MKLKIKTIKCSQTIQKYKSHNYFLEQKYAIIVMHE